MNLTMFLLTVLCSTFTGIIIYAITKRRHYKKGMTDGYKKCKSDLFRNEDINEYGQQMIEKWKSSTEFEAVLNGQYSAGELAGEKKTLEMFTLRYDAFLSEGDDFLKKTADIGYTLQLFYRSFPIGDPTKRITQHVEKFKEENFNLLVDTINNTVEGFVKIQTSLGIPVQITPAPKREYKKKVPKSDKEIVNG